MAIGEFQPIDLLGMQGGLGNLPTAANVQALGDRQAAVAAAIAGERANAMANQAQAMQVAQQQQRAQQFQAALATHLGDGSPQSTARLMTQFPEFAKQLSDAHALEKADIQEADTLQLNDIYARAANGDWAGAAANAKRRLDAEKAAGNDTTDEQDLVDALSSGDPVLQKRALGIVGMDLAARVGLDKFATVYGGVTTDDGNIVNRGTGAVTYQGQEKPAKPQYMNVDGTVIELGGGAGGNTFEQAHNFVAGVEGGYAARDGKSGAPVNYGVNQAANPDVDVKSLTPDTAKQILHDRYWVPSGAAGISDPALATVVYDTAVNMGPGMAKAMLKASGGDVEKFLDAREKRYRAIGGPDLPGWLARNAKLRDAVGGMGGGPRVVYSAPAISSRPAAPAGYQWNADGTQSPVKGGPADPSVSRAGGLKQLPAGEVEKLASEAENIAQMSDLVASFKPAFSGIGSRGGNMIAALGFGDATQNAQHDWWQGMEAVDNVVRNQLFGASLTAGEQNAWERTTVTPNMSPERITANLKRREAILKRALDRKVKVLGAAGYKADIGAALNSGATVAPSSPVASGWSIRMKGAQ